MCLILDHTRPRNANAPNASQCTEKNQSLPVGTHAKGVIDIQICRRATIKSTRKKKMSVRGAENAPEENMIKNVLAHDEKSTKDAANRAKKSYQMNCRKTK